MTIRRREMEILAKEAKEAISNRPGQARNYQGLLEANIPFPPPCRLKEEEGEEDDGRDRGRGMMNHVPLDDLT